MVHCAKPRHGIDRVPGWLSSVAWLVGVASPMFLSGNLIPALIAMEDPSFVPQPWHGYLFVMALSTSIFLINASLTKYLPLFEAFLISFTVLAFAGIIIAICMYRKITRSEKATHLYPANTRAVAVSPKLSGPEVFQTFTPRSELGYHGTLELISAQTLIFYSLLGSDGTAHMAEETRHAAIVIPRAMVWSYCIVGLLNFAMLLVVCFTWVDPDSYADSPTGYPFLAQFTTATGSVRGAITLAAFLIVLIVWSATNFMASTSRQLFAL